MADDHLKQDKSARVKAANRPPTFDGVVIYVYNDEAQTPNKGEEDGKNNGQALVPIPHGPCA